jgi:hypothetical protein
MKSSKQNVINLRYLPKTLTKKDKIKQSKMLLKSKKMYTKHKFYTRKHISSFKPKPSKYILQAKKMYNVDKIGPTNELSKKTGCSKNALAKIINKGAGAYYSSGSRPNQTSQSWGIARLASALTSGKAGAIDYNILITGCKPKSKGYKMAQLSRKKYGFGKGKVHKTNLKLK